MSSFFHEDGFLAFAALQDWVKQVLNDFQAGKATTSGKKQK